MNVWCLMVITGHTVHAVNQIMKKSLDTTNPDRTLIQTDGYGQKYIPSTNDHSRQILQSAPTNTNVWKPISTALTTLCPLLHMWCIQTFEPKIAHSELLYSKMCSNYLCKEYATSSHTSISKQTKYPTICISSSFSSKQFPQDLHNNL